MQLKQAWLTLHSTCKNFVAYIHGIVENLKQTTITALIWNLIDRFGQQVLQFAVAIIVANILLPEDYALVAMLAIFSALGNLIIESGFGAALIQKSDADALDYSTVFWWNMAMSGVLYLLLMAASPLIVGYFHEPRLVALSAVVFLSLPINATMLIQVTLLNKQIRFRQLAKADLTAMMVSAVAAISMAVGGCGVWTLAWQPVILALVKSVMLWIGSDWRPRLAFSFQRLRILFRFASMLLLSGMVNTLFLNVYSLVIPRLYPKRELGLFTQSNKICDPIVSLVYGSIQNATYPIFSSIQQDRKRLLQAYRKSIRFTSFLTFPLLIGGIMVAPALFHLLFKAAWWDAIPYFQLLCIGGCCTILTAINNNFIKVSGHASGIFKIELYKLMLTVGVILLLLHERVLVMVGGIMGVRVVLHLITMVYTQHYTGYRFRDQWHDTYPYMLLALVMGGGVYAVGLLQLCPLALLGLQILTGAALYLLLAYLTGSKLLQEALQLLTKK